MKEKFNCGGGAEPLREANSLFENNVFGKAKNIPIDAIFFFGGVNNDLNTEK